MMTVQDQLDETLPNREEQNSEVEIAALLMRQKMDVFSNGLLGEFDISGKYSISERILKELVAMAKLATDSNENLFYLVAKAGQLGEEIAIKFLLQIEHDGNMKSATLKIIEKVERANNIVNETLSTFVAKYTDEDNEYFTTKVFAIFNILTEGNDEQLLTLNAQLSPSVVLLKNRHRAMKVKMAGLTEVDKKFFEDRISLLKKSGPYGAFVLRQMAIMMRENPKQLPLKSENKYFRVMNELLDNCIERAGVIKDPSIKAAFQKVNSTFRDAVQQAENSLSIPVKKTVATKATVQENVGAPASAAKPSAAPTAAPKPGSGKDDGGGKGKPAETKISSLGSYSPTTAQPAKAEQKPTQAPPKPESAFSKIGTDPSANKNKIYEQILNDLSELHSKFDSASIIDTAKSPSNSVEVEANKISETGGTSRPKIPEQEMSL